MSAPKWDRLILARNGALENIKGDFISCLYISSFIAFLLGNLKFFQKFRRDQTKIALIYHSYCTNVLIIGLDFSLLTMLSGLSCIIFGFIWLSFGYDVSNIFMAIFFVPFGCFLVILSIWTGLAHYKQWQQYQSYQRTTYASFVQ